MAENNPQIEMGSLDLVDEILVSPAAISGKRPSLDVAPNRSFHSDGTKELNLNSMWNSVLNNIKVVLLSDKINLLVPFGPVAILVDELTSHHGWVFFLSLLGIIPLTDRLSYRVASLLHQRYSGICRNYAVGGLPNATFGNATELIISMHAMKNGMIRVVQQTLLGSILSNMLLVLGCAFFSGGIVHPNKEQVFNKGTAVMNSGLLLMAVMGLLFPAVLHFTH